MGGVKGEAMPGKVRSNDARVVGDVMRTDAERIRVGETVPQWIIRHQAVQRWSP